MHSTITRMERAFEEERLELQSRAQLAAEERESYFEREKLQLEEGFQRAMLELEDALEGSDKVHAEFVEGLKKAQADEMASLELRLHEEKEAAIALAKMDLADAQAMIKDLQEQLAAHESGYE